MDLNHAPAEKRKLVILVKYLALFLVEVCRKKSRTCRPTWKNIFPDKRSLWRTGKPQEESWSHSELATTST